MSAFDSELESMEIAADAGQQAEDGSSPSLSSEELEFDAPARGVEAAAPAAPDGDTMQQTQQTQQQQQQHKGQGQEQQAEAAQQPQAQPAEAKVEINHVSCTHNPIPASSPLTQLLTACVFCFATLLEHSGGKLVVGCNRHNHSDANAADPTQRERSERERSNNPHPSLISLDSTAHCMRLLFRHAS